MYSEAPNGYRVRLVGGSPIQLERRDRMETIPLTNRPFELVNRRLGRLPGMLIDEAIAANYPDQVGVLDIGGGMQSRAASDLVRKYGTDIRIVNYDLMADEGYFSDYGIAIRGDASALQLPDLSFDVVYSHMLLPNIEDITYGKQWSILAEVVRVLKPGGIGVIHESEKRKAMFQQYIEGFTFLVADDPEIDVIDQVDNLIILTRGPLHIDLPELLRIASMQIRVEALKDFFLPLPTE